MKIYIIFLFSFCLSLVPLHKDITFSIDLNSKYNASELITTFTPELAVYYAGFVGSAYCYENQILQIKCCNKEITFRGWNRFNMTTQSSALIDLLFSHIQDKYNFQILYSDIHQKVLVLFPGTRTEKQLYLEFFSYAISPFNHSSNGRIYSFFNTVYTLFKHRVFTQLNSFYKQNPKAKEYQTIFEGHSLGAAMALVFTEAAIENKIVARTEDSPVLITFGQPRVGNSAFVNKVDQNIPIYFRIVHMGDPIADLPPQTIKCLGGTLKCPETEYIFVHGKGLKMINRNNTNITECYQTSLGEYDNPLCVNKIADYSSFVPHTHYFWINEKITEMCPPEINA